MQRSKELKIISWGGVFSLKTSLKRGEENHALQLQMFLTKRNLIFDERLNQT